MRVGSLQYAEAPEVDFEEIPWAEAPMGERLQRLGAIFVERDIEQRIVSILDRVRRNRLTYNEPRNIVVFGETGVGKSDIMARYLQANRECRLEDGNLRRPVLLVELRNSATPASLAKQMLSQLGVDEEFHNVSTTDLSKMLKQQMIGQGVEIAILDEFHNTLTGPSRTNRVAEWVKDLSKTKTRTPTNPHGSVEEIIPFVLVGTRKVRDIIDPALNGELASITPYVIEINRYRYRDIEERKEFKEFLDRLDIQLPFDEDSGLGTTFADKLHTATFGLLRQVAHIVMFAAECALADGSNRIHEHHLQMSVEEQLAILQSNLIVHDSTPEERSRVVTNPFNPPLLNAAAPQSRRGYQVRP